MNKNPFVNALAATAYITALVSVVFSAPKTTPFENTIMAPIMFLSVFVLSAAVMGFLFVYQPLRLFFENKQQEAVRLFLLTIVSFAGITIVLVALWFFLSTVL
ncbi:hypothetical protein D4R49_00620 [bacterium]|nr:MAG: hypothetical protein D4R49_00620 [bacterium]